MTIVVPMLAGLGLAALVSGLPILRRPRLSDRVEPYLTGLQGRPSGLARTAPNPSRIAARVARSFPPPDDLARRLAAAGDERSPEAFRAEQTVWALGGLTVAIVCVIAATSVGVALDPVAVPAFALLASLTGWTARDWALGKAAERRRGALSEELPPAIDLLVLALMAGESVPAAFARLTTSVGDPLRSEIEVVLGDVRAGEPVVEALEAFGRRVDDPAVARFVDALCTGIEKGAPLADVLRAQADDGRELRRRRLLEIGGRREVLMLVPVVFLIMPVVVIWALFPGLVSLDLLVP